MRIGHAFIALNPHVLLVRGAYFHVENDCYHPLLRISYICVNVSGMLGFLEVLSSRKYLSYNVRIPYSHPPDLLMVSFRPQEHSGSSPLLYQRSLLPYPYKVSYPPSVVGRPALP